MSCTYVRILPGKVEPYIGATPANAGYCSTLHKKIGGLEFGTLDANHAHEAGTVLAFNQGRKNVRYGNQQYDDKGERSQF